MGLWDDFGKDVLASELEAAGAVVELEREVRTRAQRVDCWVVAPAVARSAPALLRRMTESVCAFEIVSRAAGSDDVLNAARKMLNVAQTRARGRKLLANFAPLWVISAGRPRKALRELGARAMGGWPSGFHEVPGPLPVRVVVVPELPPGDATRCLRLLGRGDTLLTALAEVRTGGQDSEEARALRPVVLRFRRELERASGKELLMRKETAEWFEAFTQETREAGRRDTLEEVLKRQLERRFGALPLRVRRKLAKASAGDLDKWVERFATAGSIGEVFEEA